MIVWNSCRWLGYYLDHACGASAIVPVPTFPCYCAYAIVPVPSCPCHRARAIVPVNDTYIHVGEARKSMLIEEICHDRSISIEFCVHVCDAASLVGTECIIVAKNG